MAKHQVYRLSTDSYRSLLEEESVSEKSDEAFEYFGEGGAFGSRDTLGCASTFHSLSWDRNMNV